MRLARIAVPVLALTLPVSVAVAAPTIDGVYKVKFAGDDRARGTLHVDTEGLTVDVNLTQIKYHCGAGDSGRFDVVTSTPMEHGRFLIDTPNGTVKGRILHTTAQGTVRVDGCNVPGHYFTAKLQ